MRTSFLEQIENIEQSANDFIVKNVTKKIVLATEKELEKNDSLIHELPCVNTESRHGDPLEFGVVAVSRKNSNVVLHCVGKGENEGDTEDFDLSDIEGNALCFLADLIAKKL